MIPQLNILDFDYPLPEERIAKYPLPERDASKLLVCRDGRIEERRFPELPGLLPSPALMVFNETRVVPARMHFQRLSGAVIEIFCLEPVSPAEYVSAFAATESCQWKCVIGNAKRWKGDILSLCNPFGDERVARMDLRAELVSREDRTGVVSFRWADASPFSQVLDLCGSIPIPPYLGRETEEIDLERYQTTYARIRGSVAAPTAGLHFTEREMEAIRSRGIRIEKVCLHVGAGTFLPVKSEHIAEHPMHREPYEVSLDFLKTLREGGRPVIAVGTTSMRTLESLYWAGVQCLTEGAPGDVPQWMPYETEAPWSLRESLDALIAWLESRGLQQWSAGTRILIAPGYRFHVVDALVTNFHQPQSTLLLLVSAFLGGGWRPVYRFALDHGFRFLSYGDSSLLFRDASAG